MSATSFPVPAFYYSVEIDKAGGSQPCKEVSGIQVTQNLEKIVEGGTSSHARSVKTRTEYGDVTIKLPIMHKKVDKLKSYRKDFFNSKNEDAKRLFDTLAATVTITLLDEKEEPVLTWILSKAVPVKWAVEPFSSMENKISMESITFAFDLLTIA